MVALGDFVDITYRTGVGTEKVRVQARRAGSTVEVKMPERGDLFVKVTEINKANAPVRTSRFAASEVVAIDEGNSPVVVVNKLGKK